ncbi:hypothetical protein ACP275_09G035800 [Erythranthe tilingii]
MLYLQLTDGLNWHPKFISTKTLIRKTKIKHTKFSAKVISSYSRILLGFTAGIWMRSKNCKLDNDCFSIIFNHRYGIPFLSPNNMSMANINAHGLPFYSFYVFVAFHFSSMDLRRKIMI